MPDKNRKSLELLKDTIRNKRASMGLPAEGQLDTAKLLEVLRKNPPVDKLVGYVRQSIENDRSEAHLATQNRNPNNLTNASFPNSRSGIKL